MKAIHEDNELMATQFILPTGVFVSDLGEGIIAVFYIAEIKEIFTISNVNFRAVILSGGKYVRRRFNGIRQWDVSI